MDSTQRAGEPSAHAGGAGDTSWLRELEKLAGKAEREGALTVGEVLEAMGERAFGFPLLVLALPCAPPFLYGVPQVVAVPILLLTLQMLAGRRAPWMPETLFGKPVRSRRLSAAILEKTARFARRWFGWLEAASKPRLSFLTRPFLRPLYGLVLTIFAASILIPLPGTNTVPGIAVALTAIGLMERDGLVTVGGLIAGALWIGGLIAIAVFGTDAVLSLVRPG